MARSVLMQDKSQEPLQSHELVAAFIETRLSNNLAAFKEHLPDIYQAFSHYQEERFFLIYDQDGNINLFDRESEVALYSDNAVQQCLNTLSEYEKNPVQRPYFIASGDKKVDLVNYVHSNALKKVGEHQKNVVANLVRSTIDKSIAENKEFSGDFSSCVNSLFCLSTGLGFDVEKLYLERDIKHFYVIEPNLDVFYASLQLIDWASILEKSVDKGLDLHIVIESDKDKLVSAVSNLVVKSGKHNVAGAYLYSAFYLNDYKDLYENIKSTISYSYLSGFGFYDDSRYSLAHTLGNIKNNHPILSANKKINKKYSQDERSVFIIGNGPSLDNDIDFIKNNQKSFVIVSCGSALRSLLKNGIEPDFHVELERTAHVPHWIKKSAEGIESFFEKTKKITLIAVSQVHPDVASLFGKVGIVLKDIETGSSFAYYGLEGSGVALVPRLAPSCVHTAVTVFVLMGFKKIYFFGTDMGSIDPEQHHSKDSSYQYLKKETSDKFVFKRNAEIYSSNFGDKEVYSSGVYPMFKRELESIVSGWSYTFGNDIDFKNCSDGALLKGIDPCCREDIVISNDNNSEKNEILDNVFDAFFSYYPDGSIDGLYENLSSMKDSVDKACDYAIDMISEVGTVWDVFDQVDRFSTEFHSNKVLDDDEAWLYSLFDGSLLYFLSCINSTAMLPADEAVILPAVNKQFDELKDFFEQIKKDFRENCTEWDKESRYSMFAEEEAVSSEA